MSCRSQTLENLGRIKPESLSRSREHHNTSRLGTRVQTERIGIPPETAFVLEEQRNQIAQLQKQILGLEEKPGNPQQVLGTVHELTGYVARQMMQRLCSSICRTFNYMRNSF